jgi:iron complex outermembrane receptor protein
MTPCLHARPRTIALALGFTFVVPLQAYAQTIPTVEITADAPRAGSLLDLDTPLDTASRLGLSARETPATVTVVDRALIDVRGAQDTQEILRAIPGVTAHNAPGNISA